MGASGNIGYATFITQIREDGMVKELEDYLRTHVEPLYDEHNGEHSIVKCREIRFDEIPNLHFCSFIILDRDGEEFPPCLVFEATFDGSRDSFLDELLRLAPKAIDKIYSHCKCYPESGLEAPKLVRDYFAAHDVGAHTIFRGSPGRTVEQTKGERHVYNALTEHIREHWQSRGRKPAELKAQTQTNPQPKILPATFGDVQQELQQVIRKKPNLRWTEQQAAVPSEVAQRKIWAVAAVAAFLVALCGLGSFALNFFGLGITNVYENLPTYARQLSEWPFGHSIYLPVPLLGLLVLLLGVRFAEFTLEYENPRQGLAGMSHFWLWYLVEFLTVVRYGLLGAFVGFAVLLLGPPSKSDLPFETWLSSLHHPFLWALVFLIGAAGIFALLRYARTSLQLAIQFEELEPRAKDFRLLLIDVLFVAMVAVAVFAIFVISPILPQFFNTAVAQLVYFATRVVLSLAIFTFAGVFIFFILVGVVFLAIVRFKEIRDRSRFSDAAELTTIDNSRAYAREEGGINTYQNFLASLTYVKPGLYAIRSLRLTLFVIGLLARFWYNVGDLGDIPTILSARWVIIDHGRRLLFLDHYGGAWESYLNEFIDMSAVIGLNSIWTSTFVKAHGKQYGFPETEYRFWKGAQQERPFKAYVRQSQIETLVWYSAYPTLSTVNINTFNNIRQSLFKPLDSCEVDSLLQHL